MEVITFGRSVAGSFLSGTSCEREAKELESCNICRTHLQIFCLLKIRRNGSDYAESLLYAHMLETLPSCFKRELCSRKTDFGQRGKFLKNSWAASV